MTVHAYIDLLERSTLVMSIAIIVVLLLRRSVRQWLGARATYLLWSLAPLAMLAILLPAPTRSLVAMLPTMASHAPSTAHVAAAPAAPQFDAQPVVLCIWLFGAIAMLLWFVFQQRRYLRNLGRLSATETKALRAQSTSGCPALVGALRPRIVLPQDFETRYAPGERELIFAHEQIHLARGDAQINALVLILRCLHWFNPFIHFAASRLRFDQELACDAIVLSRYPEARRAYADAMLKTQLADFGLPVGCHWQSSHPLKERITMLKRPLPGRARTALGISLIAGLIVAGSYAAWAAQPAVEKIQPKVSGRIVILKYKFQEDANPVSSDLAFGGALGMVLGEINADNDEWRVTLKTSPRGDGGVLLTANVTLHDGQVVPWMEKEVVPGEPFVMSNFVALIGHTLTLRGTLAVHNPADGCPDPKQFSGSTWTAFEADVDKLKGSDKFASVGIGRNDGRVLVVDGIRSSKNVRAVSEDGKGFYISFGTKAYPRKIDVVPQPQADGSIRVDFTVHNGDATETIPAMLVNENQEFDVKVDAANGQPPLDLAFTVARINPEEAIPEVCRNSIADNTAPIGGR